MSTEQAAEPSTYWFVGAYSPDTDPTDQTARFLSEGIWENGFDDHHLEAVESMRPGDRIAIKSTVVRTKGLPFDNRGRGVPAMEIKAVGRITRNPGDGRRVDVEWQALDEPKEWYFFTGRETVWGVQPTDWLREGLVGFAFHGRAQDIARFRNSPQWAERFGDDAPAAAHAPDWAEFYMETASALLGFKERRPELLAALREMQQRHEVLDYMTDRDKDGKPAVLTDICPFTIMGSFNRGISPAKRRAVAEDWATVLGVESPVPSSFDGIPTLNNLNSWFFTIAHERSAEDIDALWALFEAALGYADDPRGPMALAFGKAHDRVRRIHGIGVKLSMALFWIRPWRFLPLDGRTRHYLKKELMFPNPLRRLTGQEYTDFMELLTAKFEDPEYPVHSFPELAYAAFLGPDDGADNDSSRHAAPVLEAGSPYSTADIVADGCFMAREELDRLLDRWRGKKNIILQGPPGTGKTWLARRLAYALIGDRDQKQAVLPVQFHPNASYEDFVRGWRPGSDGRLALVDGPFLDMVNRANQNPDVPHVVLIEEINRGNPVQIFGELLTLIEAGKRSPREGLRLAYPRTPDETVHVPSNLYIIGTMNLADRSLTIMDLAFRRRFGFFTLEPAVNDRWKSWIRRHHDVPEADLEGVRLRFAELNRRIAEDPSLGRQFMLGHSFVTPRIEEPVESFEDWFRTVVETEIGPTLEEYWFDSPELVAEACAALLN